MNQELFNRIEELFYLKISIKTNWGRKQLKQAWQESKIQAMAEMINKVKS